jgi:hypothetical protein
MRIFWFIVLPFLVSCASVHQDIPVWGNPPDAEACSGLHNIYENLGEIARTEAVKNYNLDAYTPRLSDYVFDTPDGRIAANPADFIELTQNGAVLDIRALRGGEVIASMQSTEAAMICQAGWLVFKRESSMPNGSGNIALGYGDDTTMLRSTDDGWLVLKRISRGGGLALLVVPVADTSITYMRFHRK